MLSLEIVTIVASDSFYLLCTGNRLIEILESRVIIELLAPQIFLDVYDIE